VYGGGTNCPAWTLGTGSSSELSPQAQSWGGLSVRCRSMSPTRCHLHL
jgi:hypothetical protein